MIRISKIDRKCSGVINLPASKSISSRLLILQFYYNNSFRIENLSGSEDTLLLSSILDQIRRYRQMEDLSLLRINARNAGTVLRFLIPLLSITRGHFLLTGSVRMKQRPVGGLVEAMRETGAEIDYIENIGYPPLLIRGRNVTGGRIRLDASLSSQFVTALLLLAPTLEDGLTIELTGDPVSWPYVRMTTGILSNQGVQVFMQGNTIRVYRKKDITKSVTVEADWSAASFWYTMLSLAEDGKVLFPGLRKSGLQGDQQAAIFFRDLGVKTSDVEKGTLISKSERISENFYGDFADFPDLALPVILACAGRGIPGMFTGLDRLKIKESDRIEAVSRGLREAGVKFLEKTTGTWKLSGHLNSPANLRINDYEDHRVAMTFAALALKGFVVNMEHPEVVNKSYPGFWKDIEKSGFTCSFSC
jgi:3-phosphoshikimate 1-carboxyvinyltransferase